MALKDSAKDGSYKDLSGRYVPRLEKLSSRIAMTQRGLPSIQKRCVTPHKRVINTRSLFLLKLLGMGFYFLEKKGVKMARLELYEACPNYVKYLRQFDENVLAEKATFKQKRYVGTIIPINSQLYFLPLSSPKEKHDNIDGRLDTYKLDSGNLGVININKMFPINKENATRIKIKDVTNKQYRYLLKKQYKYMNDKKAIIDNRANKVYIMATKEEALREYEEKVKKRCCNFRLLEEKLEEYTA